MSQHIAELKAFEEKLGKKIVKVLGDRQLSTATLVNELMKAGTQVNCQDVWSALLRLKARGKVVRETRKSIPQYMVRFTTK